MNTKPVYQLDDDGYLLGITTAFESPLEPGVFHIPRNCIDTSLEPPKMSHVDDKIKWNGSSWIIHNETLEQERLKLKEIQKIEDDKKRQEELKKLEEEKQKQTLLNKEKELSKKLEIVNRIEELEKILKTNNELSNLTYGEQIQIQTEIAQLKEKLWQH